MKGELEQALDYYQRSLTLITILQDDVQRARTLTGLILVTLSRQDRIQSQTYLTDLQKTNARIPESKHIQIRTRLMEALVFKLSPRMIDKSHAQTLLRQLVTEEHFKWRWHLTMQGLLHLCDLLIYEARATGEREAWEEAKSFLDQFHTRSREKKYTEFIAEALLLQAKFALIDGELKQAENYLKESRTIATDLGISLLVEKVEAEQKQLITDFERWSSLIRQNATLQERLEKAHVEEYIQKAQETLARHSSLRQMSINKKEIS